MCFDNIDHNYLLEKFQNFPYKRIIESWLKAGVIYEGIFFSTAKFGTPQGSTISPLLALHGIEEELGVKLVNKEKHYIKTGSRSFIRYGYANLLAYKKTI